jgi:hypothetical protein
MRNLNQAIKDQSYPTIPATWPNRAVRRAVQTGREWRLPKVWAVFLAGNMEFRKAIKASRLACARSPSTSKGLL